MPKKFAISDIHGNSLSFRQLVLKLNLQKGDKLFLLGDFIDRGPNSKMVFDSIFQLINNGIDVNCIKGNHEELLLDSIINPSLKKHWLYYCGGVETMISFEKDEPSEIDEKYLSFIEKMPYYIREDNYILVHAGLDFSDKQVSPFYNRKQLLWIRNWHNSIDYNWLGDEIIIHGHTPVEQLQIELMKDQLNEKKYLNIDNGCFKIGNIGLGNLCAFNLNNHNLIFQENIDI